ncbi:hypothetical protein OEA41_001489 [Lepraria neglecta]|uniref:Uncharacterized protein n=1 Tax=Lepraria neglecta TaxID=209136 RepID=A0AAD9ZA68_9LECA|nr:hypothetical protein OEA41_001489 [Lepraria neglecta]
MSQRTIRIACSRFRKRRSRYNYEPGVYTRCIKANAECIHTPVPEAERIEKKRKRSARQPPESEELEEESYWSDGPFSLVSYGHWASSSMSTLPGEARSRPSSVTPSPDQQNYADRELQELYEIANQLLESELDESPRVVPYGTTLRTSPTEDCQGLLRQLSKELPFQDNKAVAEHRKHGLPARQDQGSTISQNGGQPRSQRLDWPARHVSTSIQAIQETSPGSIFRQFARPVSATEPDVHEEKPTTDGRY